MSQRRPLIDSLEPRRLFAYDVAFVDAVTTAGTYRPGDTLTADFTFRNDGDTASPFTRFLVFLTKGDFFGSNGQPSGSGPEGYGGIPFFDREGEDGSVPEGFGLGIIAPGQTRTFRITRPVSEAVFNGGLYNFYVFAGTVQTDFIALDANPLNNFGASSLAQVSITGGANGGGNEGSGGSDPQPVVGDLDTSFGDNNSGVATSALTGPILQTLATVFDPATSTQFALAQQGTSVVLLRFLPGGSLDTSFGNNGAQALPTDEQSITGASLVRLADGRLIASGSLTDGSRTLLARFTPTGDLDTTFGAGGIASIETAPLLSGAPFLATAIAVRPDGGIFVAGNAGAAGSRNGAVLRLSPEGVLVPTYGVGGVAVLDTGGDDTARTLSLLSKDQVLVAGSSTLGAVTRAVAARLLANGTRDLKFGAKGVFTLTAQPGGAEEFTVAATGLKDVVTLAGYSALGGDNVSSSLAFVTRISAAGKTDGRFGARGISRLTNLAGVAPLAIPNTLILTPDGGALIGAQTAGSQAALANSAIGAALVRIDGSGKFITNFGTGGVSLILQPGDVFPAAAPDAQAGFQSFLAARDGATTQIPGGKVRTLASQASADGTQTGLQVAQSLADGVDLSPTFDGALPASVQGGTKTTLRFRISNLGTLPATGDGQFAVSLVPVGPGSEEVDGAFATGPVKLKLLPGATAKSSLSVTFPAVADGLYVLQAGLSSSVADIGPANNTASGPNQVTIRPRFSDLGIEVVSGPGVLTPGSSRPLVIRVSNSGNSVASGRGTLQVFAISPGDTAPAGDALPFATLPLPLGIAPNKPRDARLVLKIPTNETVFLGQSLFFRLIGPDNASERDLLDNIKVVPTPIP